MHSAKPKEEEGAFWRRLTLPEEDRCCLFPITDRRCGYRWFRSENVVCIEHFRQPHGAEERAGKFGWLKGLK
jgi:hypothetical protein